MKLILGLALVSLAPTHTLADKSACDTPSNQAITHQREEYCEAAETAERGEKAHTISMITWTGVTAICGSACAQAEINQAMSRACSIGNIAGTGIDIAAALAIAKTNEAALAALGGAGATMLAGAQFGGGAGSTFGFYNFTGNGLGSGVQGPPTAETSAQNTETQEAAKEAACISAVMSGLKAVTAGVLKKMESDAADDNYKQAAALVSIKPKFGFKGKGRGLAVPDRKGSLATGSKLASTQTNQESNFDAQCSSARKSGNAAGIISCATALDSTIPKAVATPEFLDAFKDATGVGFGEFAAAIPDDAGPAESLGAALGAKDGTIAERSAALRGLEQQIAANMKQNTPTYAGGSASGGGSKGEDEVASAMKDFLGKLNPNGEEKKLATKGVSEIEIKMNKLSADEISKDRSISLFSRVTYRYQSTRPRLENLPWASPYNRAIASSRVRSSTKK